jgi:formylglycine-generating enzyme required for sulfatase activity
VGSAKVTLTTPIEMTLIHIPAGEFLMGSDKDVDKDAQSNELPQHRLHLPEYYIGKTPVTNAHYRVFVQDIGHRKPSHWENGEIPSGKERHPVFNVDWHDAIAFCAWLSEQTGKPFRLPSEAEWEKAARGTDGLIYPWGNQWDSSRCNTKESGIDDTTPVGKYSPRGDSPYGCVDMAGNVWEWMLSLDKAYPYDPGDGRENLDAGGLRVLRGGAFTFSTRYARCACRSQYIPDYWFNSVGFRVCVSPSGP